MPLPVAIGLTLAVLVGVLVIAVAAGLGRCRSRGFKAASSSGLFLVALLSLYSGIAAVELAQPRQFHWQLGCGIVGGASLLGAIRLAADSLTRRG